MKQRSWFSKHGSNLIVYIILTVMALLWIFPIVWVVLTSFREESGTFVPYFIPKGFTLDNYKRLFTPGLFPFGKWFCNTLFVATLSCIFGTAITLAIAYVLSRMRFKMRKPIMKIALILNMFPGFMSMIAVYYIFKALNLTKSLWALILVYSAGAALQFYIAKGFFDTIPKALDESAMLDGATQSQIFWKITLPLSKPIVVYTALMAFLGPWMDFIFAKIILGDSYNKYTVAVGLFTMLTRESINTYFTAFAAGSVLIAIPITILFMCLQKYYVAGITGGSVKG